MILLKKFKKKRKESEISLGKFPMELLQKLLGNISGEISESVSKMLEEFLKRGTPG